jgi:zinc transporter ZupT
MNAVLLSIVALFSTVAGGSCALRFRDHLHLVLGFTAGMMLGVVFFDLLPQSLELAGGGGGHRAAMVALAVGFLLFHGIEKFTRAHRARDGAHAHDHRPVLGVVSAAALVGHSLLDGVGIGLAFQVSPAVGVTVAVAVIAHDFCDGMNTVGLMLVHGNTTARALGMLALDALAPVLGAGSMFAVSVTSDALVLCMGFLSGFLLYIAASDILPRAHARASATDALRLVALTVLGAASAYAMLRALD